MRAGIASQAAKISRCAHDRRFSIWIGIRAIIRARNWAAYSALTFENNSEKRKGDELMKALEIAKIEVERLTNEVRQREDYLREYEAKLIQTKKDLLNAIRTRAMLETNGNTHD